MRRLSQKILRVLDGSPGAIGGYQRGQSLVELVLITPLLIIMVAGIIEIGWYANHVLILLEVTRVGARQATLFTGEVGYQAWEDFSSKATIHPIAYKLNNGFIPQKPELVSFDGTTGALYITPKGETAPDESKTHRDCEGLNSTTRGFYNLVVCSMLNSMDPLVLKGRDPGTDEILAKRIRQNYNYATLHGRERPNGRQAFTYEYDELFLYPDDIVVSVFSLQAINNATFTEKQALTEDPTLYSRTADFTAMGTQFPRGYQVAVVGRYPKNANECNVVFAAKSPPAGINANPAAQSIGPGESYIKNVLLLGAVGSDYVNRSWDSAHAIYGGANMMTGPRVNRTGPVPVPGPNADGDGNAANDPKPGDWDEGSFAVKKYDGTLETWQFRDPFEYYGVPYPYSQSTRDGDSSTGRWFEFVGSDDNPEFQRGFVWTGQNYVDDEINPATNEQLFCIGSEWSDLRVQNMMNSPNFLQKGIVLPPGGDPKGPLATNWATDQTNLDNYKIYQDRAKFLPSQGVVLVEMFWRHDILLDFPLMIPVIRLMEGAGGPYNIVISVWAAFPLPSAEPNFNYGFPPKP